MTSKTFDRYGVEHVVEIRHGEYVAVIASQGAALKTLHHAGAEIVSVPLPVDDFSFAGSIIAPWPNRLEDASWVFEGETLVGEVNEKANHNNLHGLTVREDFDVVDLQSSSVTFRYLIEAQPVYPFEVELRVTYELSDNGLNCKVEAKNFGSNVAPFGFAAHPYFALDAESQVKVTAGMAAVNNERKLPVGSQAARELGLRPGHFVPASSLSLDDCIYDFSPGDRVSYLTRPSLGKVVEIWQGQNLNYLMMFTRRVPGTPELIAIEPQSCPANALRSEVDLAWIEPGESVFYDWGVNVKDSTSIPD